MTLKMTANSLQTINSFQVFDGTRKSVAVSSDFFRVDLNKDGVDEILLVSMDHSYSGNFANHEQLEKSYLHIYGLSNGKWSDVTSQYLTDNKISGATNLCAGDFNGDGKVDLFIAAQTDTNIYPVSDLYLSSPSGVLVHSTLNLETWAHDSYVTDVNADGYQDVLVTDYGSNQGILFGSPSGLNFKKFYDTFVAPNWRGPWGGSGISAADFLGDGTKTILISDDSSTRYNSTNLYAWSIDASGNLNLTHVSTLPTPLFDTAKWASYQFEGYQTMLGSSHDVRAFPFDFGNDKLIDAIVISRPSLTNGVWPEFTEIQFLQNKGRGLFEDVTSTKLSNFDNKLGATPYAPVFDDFNGDGKVDIFLSGADNVFPYDSTALLIQQPDGTFMEFGKDVFTSLWDQAIQIEKQSIAGYVFTDWGNTMSLTKGPDAALYAIVCVTYQDAGAQVHDTVFSSKITLPQIISSHMATNTLTGTAGSDQFNVLSGSSTINGFDLNNDVVWIEPGAIAHLNLSGAGSYNLASLVTNHGTCAIHLAGSGTNQVIGTSGTDLITGGSGLDTVVYSGTYASNTKTHQANGSFVVADSVSGRDGIDTLTDIERLQFSDYNVALDTDSANSAGGIYRLYQAAFDRQPDLPGLGYWIKAADNGKSAVTMAEDFTWSKEFLDLFHLTTPKDNYFTGVNVKTLVEGMYTHVLHRAADSGGLNYYAGVIQSHEKTVGRVLAEISDSPENHTAVASAIANGIQYTPYTAQAMTSLHVIDDIDGVVAEPQTMALDSYSTYSDQYQLDLIGQTHDPMIDWIWLG